ncbi:MAG: glycosyltransferase family 2 protein [Bacilli bacterium]
MISIVMLVHNAKDFTKHSLKTISKTSDSLDTELIVVDNNSNQSTRKMLLKMQKKGIIDKLILLKENTMFAKGNNIGSHLCSENSEHILLINSDIEIRNKEWLKLIYGIHSRGATCLGVCENNPYTRGDGFCFLIDKDLYLKYQLDESFEWWWSITKLEAILMRDGFTVKAVKNYENILYHFGGMSGKAWKNAMGLKIEGKEIESWFNKNQISIIEKLSINKKDNINVGLKFKINFVIFYKNIKNNFKNIIKGIIKKIK